MPLLFGVVVRWKSTFDSLHSLIWILPFQFHNDRMNDVPQWSSMHLSKLVTQVFFILRNSVRYLRTLSSTTVNDLSAHSPTRVSQNYNNRNYCQQCHRKFYYFSWEGSFLNFLNANSTVLQRNSKLPWI